MIYPIVFVIVSVVGLIAAVLMFTFRDILHSAVALATVFLVNSLLFLLLGQPLLAVIQLFIMIGGITTFLFVGVASTSYHEPKRTNIAALVVVWMLTFIIIFLPLRTVSVSENYQSNVFGQADAAASFGSSTALFYLMLALMFGVALGSILLLRKINVEK